MPQRIRVRLGGALAADTTRAVRVLETHHAPSYYLPPEDIHATLRPVPGSSFCEWKSVARYFDVSAGARPHSALRGAKTGPPPALPGWPAMWRFMPG